MNNVKAPYNVNKLTSDAAENALRNMHVLEKNVKEVLVQRELVAKKLEVLEFVEKVYPSDSNFLLFRVRQKANEIYKTVSLSPCVSMCFFVESSFYFAFILFNSPIIYYFFPLHLQSLSPSFVPLISITIFRYQMNC